MGEGGPPKVGDEGSPQQNGTRYRFVTTLTRLPLIRRVPRHLPPRGKARALQASAPTFSFVISIYGKGNHPFVIWINTEAPGDDITRTLANHSIGNVGATARVARIEDDVFGSFRKVQTCCLFHSSAFFIIVILFPSGGRCEPSPLRPRLVFLQYSQTVSTPGIPAML